MIFMHFDRNTSYYKLEQSKIVLEIRERLTDLKGSLV